MTKHYQVTVKEGFPLLLFSFVLFLLQSSSPEKEPEKSAFDTDVKPIHARYRKNSKSSRSEISEFVQSRRRSPDKSRLCKIEKKSEVVMTKHYHVTLLLLSFMMLLLRVEVEANSSCHADQITIKDPVTGSIQCLDCLKCPPGEGLSVNCGDVITPSTPVRCKPCVLGETYSASFSTGACEDCENCGEYRETTKACTLTSKAKCGRCKPGAYAEGMVGLCRPCSPCCNDGNDIIIPECQVEGVPTGMQCSYLRSDKCSALVTSSMNATPSTPPPDQSTTLRWPSPSTTSTTEISPSSEPVVILNEDASPNVGILAGSVVGGLFLVLTILVIACRKVMRKRRKAFSMRTGVDKVENGAGQAQNREQGNNHEVNRDQTEDRVALPPEDLYHESLLPHPTQEEAGDKCPDKSGVQETNSPPSCKSSLDSELYRSVKKYTDLSKVQGHIPLSVVSRKTVTVTMIEVTDERGHFGLTTAISSFEL